MPAFALEKDWLDWTWQMRHAAKSKADFEKYFVLDASEKEAFSKGDGKLFSSRSTPYYNQLALLEGEASRPLRRILMPSAGELRFSEASHQDPLAERKNSPAPRIIHRYSDRVLFLVTDVCSVYCRYCTRKHFTGQESSFIKERDFTQALDYIASKKGIREVILSGGDPLTLSNERLYKVLSHLRKIEHIEIIRLGSRMPVVCPMRLDQELALMLREFAPVFLMTHFNHPKELTELAVRGLSLLVDHGVPVFNQMVLLRGVNNHPAIVQALSRRLLYLRVKPYYMFQCDPVVGTEHLRTSIEESEKIVAALWGHLSGLAMPILSLDIPNGGGKTTLVPSFEKCRDDKGRVYQGWDGVQGVYENPLGEPLLPEDYLQFEPEWEELKKSKSDGF